MPSVYLVSARLVRSFSKVVRCFPLGFVPSVRPRIGKGIGEIGARCNKN